MLHLAANCIFLLLLDNGIMKTPKRRFLLSICACCHKKIETSIFASYSDHFKRIKVSLFFQMMFTTTVIEPWMDSNFVRWQLLLAFSQITEINTKECGWVSKRKWEWSLHKIIPHSMVWFLRSIRKYKLKTGKSYWLNTLVV